MRRFLNRALSAYDRADITIQMKARLFFWICLVLMVLIPIVSGSAIYISWATHHSWTQFDSRLYMNYLMIFLCAVCSFVLLVRGHFFISAHLIVISIIAGIFVSVILERTSPICRLDSLVLIVSLLSITPMIVSRRRFSILLYGALSLAAVYAFIFNFRGQLMMQGYEVVDYLSDNTVAIVFVTLIAFALYTVNDIALSRAKAEIQERIRSEEEKTRLEAQLIQAQRMESIGRLAGGVAHDFNNLLTAILGNTTLVMQKLPPEEREHERLGVVMKAAQSTADLTRQLLAFSRRQIIEPRPVDPAVEIGNMRSLLARLIGEDIELVINAEPGQAVIKADPGQLEQILFNLVVNARDAMPNFKKALHPRLFLSTLTHSGWINRFGCFDKLSTSKMHRVPCNGFGQSKLLDFNNKSMAVKHKITGRPTCWRSWVSPLAQELSFELLNQTMLTSMRGVIHRLY